MLFYRHVLLLRIFHLPDSFFRLIVYSFMWWAEILKQKISEWLQSFSGFLLSDISLLPSGPQQPEQREQQRLSLQRLTLSLPDLPLPLSRLLLLFLLSAAPADTCPPLFNLLTRLWLHLSGCLPVQIPFTDAPRDPAGNKSRGSVLLVIDSLRTDAKNKPVSSVYDVCGCSPVPTMWCVC